jgi:hypothetical protein
VINVTIAVADAVAVLRVVVPGLLVVVAVFLENNPILVYCDAGVLWYVLHHVVE